MHPLKKFRYRKEIIIEREDKLMSKLSRIKTSFIITVKFGGGGVSSAFLSGIWDNGDKQTIFQMLTSR